MESSDVDPDEVESFLQHGRERANPSRLSKSRLLVTRLGVTILALSYGFMASNMLQSWAEGNTSMCLMGSENAYNDPPILYEKQRFQRTGFHDERHNTTTEFEGQPNEANNAAWDKLTIVGIVTISSTENSRLSHVSASTREDSDKYVVELAMFHQLHCLKWLRREIWELETGQLRAPIPQRQDHLDHCIDYLRQVIMCHGDITPITFEWSEELNSYLAHHSTEHVCRNFDRIFEWASSRADGDSKVDGNHVNVNLKKPEMFD